MNKCRLGLSVFLFLIALFPLAIKQTQAAEPTIQLIIEGERYEPDAPPRIVDGRTLVPIAIIAESLGAEVNWSDPQKKVTIVADSVELEMRIGNPKAILNNREMVLDTPPQIFDDRTFVPIRFIGQALGTHVGWEDVTKTVVVNRAYALTANGKQLNESVFNLGGELYLPLEPVAVSLGARAESERFVLNDLTIPLDRNGQQQFQLVEMDTGWMIPKSVVEERFQASVSVNNGRIEIDRLNRLRSVREDRERIYLNFTMPTAPNHFRMSSPERLVIDLPNTVIGEELRETTSFQNGSGILKKNATVTAASAHHQDLIKEIRFSQFSTDPQTVRVVVELSEKADYQLNATGTGVEVTLKAVSSDTSPVPGGVPIVPPFEKNGKFLVVLDPGHGGSDPGAIGVSGNQEKELALAVTNYLAQELKAFDEIEVIQTRTNDAYPTLQERVEMANHSQADVFVSVHGNSFNKSDIRGTETYYYTPQSKAFANTLHKRLVEATGFPDRGLKTSRFYVINHTTMPSALVEIGFMSNPADNEQMQDPVFQQKVAKALAEAIYEYYTSL